MGNKNNYFSKLPPDRRFSAEQLSLLFDHYAVKGNVMSKEELGSVMKHLCADFKASLSDVSKIVAAGFMSDVRIQSRSPERSAKHWEMALSKPLENLAKRLPQIVEEAYQMMDENKDGKLDKAEFIKNFVPVASRYFKYNVFRIYSTGASLDGLPGYQAQLNSPFSNLERLSPPKCQESDSSAPVSSFVTSKVALSSIPTSDSGESHKPP